MQESVNYQVYMLKRIGYSMREIRRLNVLRAIDQIMYCRTEDMLYHAELLSAQGVPVFDKRKGITRYIEFFDEVDAKNTAKQGKYRADVKPEKIDPANRFMEG